MDRRKLITTVLAGGGGSSVVELPTTNLLLRLDSTSALYQDVAKTTLAQNDTDPVSVWVDGQGNQDAIDNSALPDDKPHLRTGVNGIGGVNAIEMDDSQAFFELDGLTASSGPLTIYFWGSLNTATGIQRIMDIQTGRLILYNSDAAPHSGQLGYYDGSHHDVGAAVTGEQILTWVLQASGGEVFRDGVSIGTGTYTEKAIGGTIDLPAPNTALGKYGLLYIYTEAHNEAQRTAVLAYIDYVKNFT